MLVACGAAAVSLLARTRGFATAPAAVALIAAPALVAGDVWHSTRLVDLRHHPAKLARRSCVGGDGGRVGAAIFRRVRWAFPVGAVRRPAAAGAGAGRRRDGAPARPPVPGDRGRAGLLRVAELVGGRAARRRPRAEPRRRSADRRGRWLRRALAATLVLYAIQSAYSADVSNAIENASFFLVPFAVMLMLLGEVRWTQRILGGVLIAVAGDGARVRRGRVRRVRRPGTCSSAAGTCSSRTSSTSTSGSTRCSTTRTCSAAIWR